MKIKVKNKQSGIDTKKGHTISETQYWKMTNHTRNHHTKESQEVCPFQAGDYKVARNRQDSIMKTNVNNKLQKGSTKEARPWNGQSKILEGLNMFNGTNLTLSFEVDQGTYENTTKSQENTLHNI